MASKKPLLSDYWDRPYPHGVKAFIAARNPEMPPEMVDHNVLVVKIKVDEVMKKAVGRESEVFARLKLPPDSPDRGAAIRWSLESMFLYELGL